MKQNRSQSQRIRDLIFLIWEKQTALGLLKAPITFEDYYTRITNALINNLQDKLNSINPPINNDIQS